jgi:hypothetical protein
MSEKLAVDNHHHQMVDSQPGTPPSDDVHRDPSSKKNDGYRYGTDNESLISDTTLVAHQEGLKPAFLAKANILNKVIQDIGFGRYQYELFFSGGFGWFADNVSDTIVLYGGLESRHAFKFKSTLY